MGIEIIRRVMLGHISDFIKLRVSIAHAVGGAGDEHGEQNRLEGKN